jgi:hypothetical protein
MAQVGLREDHGSDVRNFDNWAISLGAKIGSLEMKGALSLRVFEIDGPSKA